MMAFSQEQSIFLKKTAAQVAVFLSSVEDNISRHLAPAILIYIAIGFVVILAGVLLFPKSPKDYLILISAIAIIIGVLLTSAVTLHSQMRDRSFELLKANRDDKNYKDSMGKIVRFLKDHPDLSKQEIVKLYVSTETNDIALCEAIKTVGNFYEEMAIAIIHKEVNEPLLRDFYIGIFVRFYQRIQPFLPVIRNEVDEHPFGIKPRPEVYIRLDELYERWHPIYQTMLKDIEAKRLSEPK